MSVNALEKPGGRRRRKPIQKGSHKWRCMVMREWGKSMVYGMPKHMLHRPPTGWTEEAELGLWFTRETARMAKMRPDLPWTDADWVRGWEG